MIALVTPCWGTRGGTINVRGRVYHVCICGLVEMEDEHAALLLQSDTWAVATEEQIHRHLLHKHATMPDSLPSEPACDVESDAPSSAVDSDASTDLQESFEQEASASDEDAEEEIPTLVEEEENHVEE